jgi:hypothetical protein
MLQCGNIVLFECEIFRCMQSSEFMATDLEAWVRFPALPGKKKVVGLEQGPLSLVSTTEELLDRKVAAAV